MSEEQDSKKVETNNKESDDESNDEKSEESKDSKKSEESKDSKSSGGSKSSSSGDNKASKGSDDEDEKKSEIEELNEGFDEDKSVKSNDSIENDDDYINLKEELDKANNLIDYFLILGLEPSIAMNKWLYENDLDNLQKLYKDKLKPKILSSFPCFEKHTIAFDDSILNHCFPDGFNLMMSPFKPKPKVFSFILDNNYFNLNYPQKYLTCFLFYENISGYRMLYEQNQRITKELQNPDSQYNMIPEPQEVIKDLKCPKIYIPKCLLIMSLYPYFGEFEKILTEIYSYSINLTNGEIKEEEKKDDSNKKLKKSQTFNRKKAKKIMGEINLPIDKIVENLCIELPDPPRGVARLQYRINNEERIIKQNLMNELPLVNINLKKLFFDYDVEDIVSMYNYLFLETRILFFSSNVDILNIYIYGLLALLYPFQYQYQIVTILPEENFEIMESITPFIAGINQTFSDDFFDRRGYTLSDLVVVVDIDSNRLCRINEESTVPKFPKSNGNNLKSKLQKVADKYLGDLKKQAKKRRVETKKGRTNTVLVDKINSQDKIIRGTSKKGTKSENEVLSSFIDEENEELFNNFNIDYDFNREINEIFFNFNATLLANYSKFLNLDFYSSNIMPCLEILFKVEEYLKIIPTTDKPFYDKFISETQIFGDFLYLRMIPKNSKEKIRILLFDEKINENSTGIFSKPPPMIFTNCQDYKFKEIRKINGPRELNKEDLDYYNNLKNRKKLLEYGILLSNINKNKLSFKYPIFPKLTTKLLFQNMLDYSPPNNWNDIIDNINVDIISKSHLSGVNLRQSDMKNYVFLCWMQMWAATFWYCEEIEKKYRFQELLKVLDRSQCYDMEIFNILFEAVSAYGQDYMVLKLYDLILKQHLNPSYKVHSIVMKIIEKQNIEGNFNEKLQSFIGNEINTKFTKNDFKKRVFRTKYYKDIMSEDIVFFAFDNCTKCNNNIDIEIICKDYKNMGRDVQWVKCPKCSDKILPKLTFQFGREINKSGDMRINTCYYDSAILYSPFTLKNNYKNTILKNFNVKLEVETFMKNYRDIFWDSLWYFKLNNLEYDFMLPYGQSVHDITETNKNLYITLKGALEKEKKLIGNDDENQPRFNFYELKITNFRVTINN